MAPHVAANPANCAAAALMLRRYKEAANFAVQAATLDPSSVRAHMRAGKACLSMGRFDEVRALNSGVSEVSAHNMPLRRRHSKFCKRIVQVGCCLS